MRVQNMETGVTVTVTDRPDAVRFVRLAEHALRRRYSWLLLTDDGRGDWLATPDWRCAELEGGAL